MKPLLRALARLYPTSWRRRYGSEFDALLDDLNPTWFDAFNIFFGALAMQLSSARIAKPIAALALTLSIFSGVVWLRMPPLFVAHTIFQIRPSGSALHSQQINEVAKSALSRHSLAGIIERNGLYPRQLATHPREEVIDNMRRYAIRIANLPNGNGNDHAFEVFFAYPDAIKAYQASKDLTHQLVRANTSIGALQITSIRHARPESPVQVSRWVALAAFWLLLLSSCWLWFRRAAGQA